MIKRLSILSLLSILFMSLSGYAQTPDHYILYSGGNNVIPFNFSSNKAQWLYYPTEFTPTAQAGNITTVYIRAGSAVTNATLPNLTIKLGTTTLTTLTSGPWVGGLTTVLAVPSFSQTATLNQWVPYVLTTPFFYDGTSNLILEVSVSTTNAGGYQVYQGSPGGNRRLYGLTANATSTGADGTQVSFGFDMVSECSGVPNAGYVVASVPSVSCGGTATLRLNSADSLPGITYQWQESADRLTWINVGTDTNVYNPAIINKKTYYRVLVGCSHSSQNAYSLMDSIDAITVPLGWTTDTVLCKGDIITLDGMLAGESYSWSTGDTTPTIQVSAPGNYELNVVALNGCVSEGTKNVTFVPLPAGSFTTTRVSFMEYEVAANVMNTSQIEWNFGDGSPLRYGNPLSHVYANHGYYTITMRALNICGESDISEFSLELKGSSVDQLFAQKGLSLFPNPAKNELTLNNKDGLKLSQIVIYNIAGSKIKHFDIQSNAPCHLLDISSLKAGNYIISVQTTDHTYNAKFVKE